MAEKSVADVLREAAAIVERGWCQGAFARTADGEPVWSRDGRACRWCMDGAIQRASEVLHLDARRIVIVGGLVPPHPVRDEIADWNDALDRTQAEVVAKLREAADLAERKST